MTETDISVVSPVEQYWFLLMLNDYFWHWIIVDKWIIGDRIKGSVTATVV